LPPYHPIASVTLRAETAGLTIPMLRFLGGVLLTAIAAAVISGWYLWRDLHRVAEPPPLGTVVSIAPGASLRSVAAQLQRVGLVRYPVTFIAWARYQGSDRSVRSGTYRLERPVSPVELLKLLQKGPSVALQWVTIPEGYTAAQVALVLEEKGFGGRDLFRCIMEDPAFLAQLDLPGSGIEGYLFPDTYAFHWTMKPQEILRTMVQRFRRESHALDEKRTRAGLTEAEMVTLASVIEKETGRAEERPMIAGVFDNRLRRGMLWQSDPTVIYGLANFDGNRTRAELDDPSPYNTYRHKGLPPGPIANPGGAALEAALAPAKTSALYFVSRNDGSHEFSSSLAQHNRAVWRYQKRGRRRK